MKKILLFTLILGASFIATSTLHAKPAYRGGIEVTQPDGTTLTVYKHGDEFFHYTTLADGTWVERQADGFLKEVPALTVQQRQQKRIQSQKLRVTEQTQQAYPLNIAPRGLVILVNFSDVKFQKEDTREVYEQMLNSDNYTANGATGSARQYFSDQSNGQYKPQFDVVGPVTLPQPMAYYGANDYSGEDQHVDLFVKKACELADKECGVDFTLYDNDKDNAVDFVFFIYAGYGEADSPDENTIWPHAYWLYKGYGQRFYVDNKRIDMYACGAELNYETKKRDGIGTFCHEFGHVLGLPDLYATDGSQIKSWGKWAIMDYGSYNNNGNTPPSYSAHERFFLGWLQPTILHESQSVELEDITTNTAYLISKTGTHNLVGNDPDATEYYMIENRQKEGWDAYIPGHGMLISKIQYDYRTWVENKPNTGSLKRIDLIEADGKSNYSRENYFGKAGDAFPAGATSYSPYTQYPITNIKETNGVITFDFMGGSTTDLDDVLLKDEQVVAIYNLLGQSQNTTDINSLSRGIYIIKTNKSTKKVSIP